jgi:hypothetical protein
MANAYGFSADDAKRIGRAVRVVERLPPQLQNTGPATPEVSRGVRLLLAKHEGSGGWAVNASAVVTIHNGTPGSVASASTIVAYNQFLTIPSGTACTTRWVALGHNGFGWYAVAREPACTGTAFTCSMTLAGIDFSAVSGFDGTKIQLLGHNKSQTGTAGTDAYCSNSASLRWYDITTCSTAA